MDSFRLLFVQMFNMKKGIIPEIAHNAISTLYSNMFEYWTFNKVNILRLIKLDIIIFLINTFPITSSMGGSFIKRSSISKLFRIVFSEEVIELFSIFIVISFFILFLTVKPNFLI